MTASWGDLVVSALLERHLLEQEPGTVCPVSFTARLPRWWRQLQATVGPATPPRVIFDAGVRPVIEPLGHTWISATAHAHGFSAMLHGPAPAGTPVALVWCSPWQTPLSRAARPALTASLAVQVPWACIFTGTELAIVDATRPWSRRALRLPLSLLADDGPTQQLLCTLMSPRGLSHTLRVLTDASDAYGAAVCASLGDRVLEAIDLLLAQWPGAHTSSDVVGQALTIVYRVLFLYFAEARGLLPTWHRRFRQAYSIEALREQLMTTRQVRGTWDALQAMSRLARTGCHIDDLQVTAFNGRLFAPALTPLSDRSPVSDAVAARLVLGLGTTADAAVPEPIRFADLGVEQLGAVYERVLDYVPARQGAVVTLTRTGMARKVSGSFYTPRSLTDFLVRRTLAPLVEGRSSRDILALRVLDPAMGSGAFLVAACRYLTDRLEQVLAEEGQPLDAHGAEARRASLARTVAERCLFGVDLNPTAVQLARLSLWMATLAGDRPLTFLDHHLVTGNSLVGAWLHDLSRPPGPARADAVQADAVRLPFGDASRQHLARWLLPDRHALANTPSDSVDAVRDKEHRLHALASADGALARWWSAADLWCGLALGTTRLTAGVYADLQAHIAARSASLPSPAVEALIDPPARSARQQQACHWELQFPEVFLDDSGRPRADAGFDAIIGNPPWEMLRADSGTTDDRTTQRMGTRQMAAFLTASGQYRLQGKGHLNHYQLFVERVLRLLAPGGRFGLLVPSGLETDAGSAHLRRTLFDSTTIDTWAAFDNRQAIFPIHRSMQFLAVAGTRGGATTLLPVVRTLSDPQVLGRWPDLPGPPSRVESAQTQAAVLTVHRQFLDAWDPETCAVPALASPVDLAIASQALAHPALASPDGWHVRFGRELNATDDADIMRPCAPGRSDTRHTLRVIDGRHVRPFRLDERESTREADRAAVQQRLGTGPGPDAVRVGYRDVASRTNRVTLIAARLPPGVVSTHTVFCSRRPLTDDEAWCLVGLLNSLVVNYLVRLQVSVHVSAGIMARLPVPRPSSDVQAQLAVWARALGEVTDAETVPDTYADLNAGVADLYGLSTHEFRHVLSGFPLIPEALRERCAGAFAQRGRWRSIAPYTHVPAVALSSVTRMAP